MRTSSLILFSSEPLAEAINRPRTSAVSVPSTVRTTFTSSQDCSLRWWGGRRVRRNIPNSAAPIVHKNTIALAARANIESPAIGTTGAPRATRLERIERPQQIDHVIRHQRLQAAAVCLTAAERRWKTRCIPNTTGLLASTLDRLPGLGRN